MCYLSFQTLSVLIWDSQKFPGAFLLFFFFPQWGLNHLMSINRSVVEIHLFLTLFGLYKIVIFLLSVVCHYHSRKCDFGFKSWMPLVLSTCYIRQYITFAIAYVSIYFNEALQREAQISCFS